MQEREIKVREGELIKPDGEVVKVQIIDRGEGMGMGEPSNHDRVDIVYPTDE